MNYLKNLYYGQDRTCQGVQKGYIQKVVLVNKNDLESYNIESELVENGNLEPLAKHRISFKLKDNKSGILIENNQNSQVIVPNVQATYSDELPRYTHSLQFAVYGVTERTKWLLMTLSKADYFAAVLHKSGVVEVYGFEFGMKTDGYTFDAGDGGAIIKLSSVENEFHLPYNYHSLIDGGEVVDFEEQFNLKDAQFKYKAYNNSFNSSYTS
ncbi:hypothetical protein [Empedobacter brevis]|uniref:hypothetical protein n=1 Tax=Empedobacter brevis TaxID=247 RepID=UPI0028A835DF|nr:hypothetical protein [Empedobacter brevis]